YDRLMFDNLAASNADNQVAVSIESQPLGPSEAEFNLPGIGFRREHEVVLQLALVAVVNQVHPGIDLPILHSAKCRNIALPLGRIFADEVVALACEFIDSANLCIAVGVLQPDA